MGLFRELVGRISLDASGWQRGLRNVEKFTDSTTQRLRQSVRGQLAAAFSTAAVIATTRAVVRYGSRVSDLAQRLGISNEALQEQEFWVKQNGAEMQDLITFTETLNRARDRANRGNQQDISDFAMFGIALEDINRLSPEEKLRRINTAFMEIGRNEDTIGALLRLGGESAGKLVPALSQDLEKFASAAHDLGQVMAEDVVNQLDQVSDKFDQLSKRFMTELAPAIGSLVVLLESASEKIRVNAAIFKELTKERDINSRDFTSFMTGLGTPLGQVRAAKVIADWLTGGIEQGARKQTEIDDERAARAGLSLPGRRSGLSPASPSIDNPDNAAAGPARSKADALVSVGNFLGLDPTSFSRESLAQQRMQTQLLEQISRLMLERDRRDAISSMERGFVG